MKEVFVLHDLCSVREVLTAEPFFIVVHFSTKETVPFVSEIATTSSVVSFWAVRFPNNISACKTECILAAFSGRAYGSPVL